ncbi:site-specific integrase [Paracoccus sp. MC1862]|uniref:tyrosine-type recombinase/integrase n=1 Tax=Paracoccus sp. MC1862 TaxID=2760307 RepID=UPI0015FF7167|nr:site-specific integrase [Paracoccus sp. MC1862]MBB1498794.1 site-specific integrase [Paracoccus sp. MC1862]QQO43800.1 site-specific integrase [Paracoccus sp. MC1862]
MPLTIYKRGKIWHLRGTVAGRLIRETTETSDRKTAERIKAEVESRAWQRRLDGPGAGLTMAEVFHAYLDADKSDRFLLKLAQHWKDTPVAEVYPETIRRAAKLIYPEANEPTWNRQVIKPTQAAINYAAGLGWCPRISVKRYTEDPEIKTPATIAWVRAFHTQALVDGLPHLGALCMFMFGTAARVGESCRMTWGDVDLSLGTAKLYLFKPTPWNRVAHLQPELVAAMANLPTNRKTDELVFDYTGRGSLRGAWNNVCKRADIERLTPHCCRHGFATSMLQAGYDVKTVAERGGWKDAATVLRTYAHAIKDRSVTNVLFDTPAAQEAEKKIPSIRKIRRKKA